MPPRVLKPGSAQLGLIGLGLMGRPMARNLLRAGYRLVVYSRRGDPVRALEAEGAQAC